MKTFRALLFVFCFAAILGGCKCPPVAVQSSVKAVHDSSSTVVVPRLETQIIPGREMTYSVHIECDPATDKPKPFKKEFTGAGQRSTLNMDASGQLHIQDKCDSIAAKLWAMDTKKTTIQRSTITITKTVEVTKPLPKWLKLLAAMGLASLILLLLKAFLFISKKTTVL